MASDRAELLRARAATYEMGAAALHPSGPSPEVLAMLRAQGANGAMVEAFGDTIGDALGAFSETESDLDIKRDYDARFCVPSASRVILTENFIRTEAKGKRRRKPFQGPTTAEVAKFYGAVGFSFDRSGMADHLSVELEFMALLSNRLADGLDGEGPPAEAAAAERTFLLEHMVPWVEVLAGVSELASTEGLKAILLMIASVIADHAADFDVVPAGA